MVPNIQVANVGETHPSKTNDSKWRHIRQLPLNATFFTQLQISFAPPPLLTLKILYGAISLLTSDSPSWEASAEWHTKYYTVNMETTTLLPSPDTQEATRLCSKLTHKKHALFEKESWPLWGTETCCTHAAQANCSAAFTGMGIQHLISVSVRISLSWSAHYFTQCGLTGHQRFENLTNQLQSPRW